MEWFSKDEYSPGLVSHTILLQYPQFVFEVAKSVHVPEQQPGCCPTQGKAVQDPQCLASKARSEQVPAQHAGARPVHYISRPNCQYRLSRSLVLGQGRIYRLTVLLHEPQWLMLLLRSVHELEQHAGLTPVHWYRVVSPGGYSHQCARGHKSYRCCIACSTIVDTGAQICAFSIAAGWRRTEETLLMIRNDSTKGI